MQARIAHIRVYLIDVVLNAPMLLLYDEPGDNALSYKRSLKIYFIHSWIDLHSAHFKDRTKFNEKRPFFVRNVFDFITANLQETS